MGLVRDRAADGERRPERAVQRRIGWQAVPQRQPSRDRLAGSDGRGRNIIAKGDERGGPPARQEEPLGAIAVWFVDLDEPPVPVEAKEDLEVASQEFRVVRRRRSGQGGYDWSVASTLSSTLPLSATEIGQPSLAASAAVTKSASDIPGT